MSVREWIMCGVVCALFACIALTVWGLGRTLQSLFD